MPDNDSDFLASRILARIASFEKVSDPTQEDIDAALFRASDEIAAENAAEMSRLAASIGPRGLD